MRFFYYLQHGVSSLNCTAVHPKTTTLCLATALGVLRFGQARSNNCVKITWFESFVVTPRLYKVLVERLFFIEYGRTSSVCASRLRIGRQRQVNRTYSTFVAPRLVTQDERILTFLEPRPRMVKKPLRGGNTYIYIWVCSKLS